MSPTSQAYHIASDALDRCQTTYGMIAGMHHFVDIWGRDALFATWGTTAARTFEASKTTIETFIHFQRPDGFIPYRVMRTASTIGKYVGKPSMRSHPGPSFRSHQSGALVLDGGLLTTIATAMYWEFSRDTAFVRRHIGGLAYGMDWLRRREHNGLLSEWFLGEWMDSILKIGKTLYTNVLYYGALVSLAKLHDAVHLQQQARSYRFHAKRVQQAILDAFWTGTYLADWIDYRRHDYFASYANFLAVWFEVVDRKKVQSIVSYAKRHCLASFTIETNYPTYPFWRISILHHMVGMADYHNRGCLWLQPGLAYVLSLWKLGKKKEARDMFARVSRHIVRHGGVFEVYEKNGMPLARLWYQSEEPFAWSAGLYVFAYHLLYGR